MEDFLQYQKKRLGLKQKIEVCSFDSNRIVQIGRSSSNSIHATHYLKFSVKITTNQLHYHFRNKVPFMKKEVSKLRIEYESF